MSWSHFRCVQSRVLRNSTLYDSVTLSTGQDKTVHCKVHCLKLDVVSFNELFPYFEKHTVHIGHCPDSFSSSASAQSRLAITCEELKRAQKEHTKWMNCGRFKTLSAIGFSCTQSMIWLSFTDSRVSVAQKTPCEFDSTSYIMILGTGYVSRLS